MIISSHFFPITKARNLTSILWNCYTRFNVVAIQLLSPVWLFVTPWAAAQQASLSFTISLSLLKLMSIDAIQPSHPLSPPAPPALSLAQHQESFPMSWLFVSGDQGIGASTSASVLPMNIQGWFPLGWTTLISLLSKELPRIFSITAIQKHQFFGTQPSLWSSSHMHHLLSILFNGVLTSFHG